MGRLSIPQGQGGAGGGGRAGEVRQASRAGQRLQGRGVQPRREAQGRRCRRLRQARVAAQPPRAEHAHLPDAAQRRGAAVLPPPAGCDGLGARAEGQQDLPQEPGRRQHRPHHEDAGGTLDDPAEHSPQGVFPPRHRRPPPEEEPQPQPHGTAAAHPRRAVEDAHPQPPASDAVSGWHQEQRHHLGVGQRGGSLADVGSRRHPEHRSPQASGGLCEAEGPQPPREGPHDAARVPRGVPPPDQQQGDGRADAHLLPQDEHNRHELEAADEG
mmetsp:Transcript_15229/g.36220  ORF Transcript_15229/g.36220 Transcript_15229/m.36220 type:complete len:270 (+) Transcript_15229:1355-2164(+)